NNEIYDGAIIDIINQSGDPYSNIFMKNTQVFGKEYVVFDNRQIKSAIGNIGTFDSNNPNIIYEYGGQIKTQIMNSNNPFIADNYFKANPEKVLGEQSIGGQYGTSIIVKGTTKDIENISVPAIEKVFKSFSNQSFSEQNIGELIDSVIDKAQDTIIHKRVNEPADISTTFDTDSFQDIVKKYNNGISREELEAYLYSQPELPYSKYIKEFEFTKDQLIKDGYLFYINGNYEYKYVYLSGNINSKLIQLKSFDKNKIIDIYGEEHYKKQLQLLNSNKPQAKRIGMSENDENRIILLPHAELAVKAKIKGILAVSDESPNTKSISEWFVTWLNDFCPSEEFKKSTKQNIQKYYLSNKEYRIDKKRLSKEEIEREEKLAINLKQRAKEEGDRLFNKFLSEQLMPEDRTVIEGLWNDKYNGLVICNYSKIPVGFTCSKWIKNKSPFRLSDAQREGVAFSNVSGCGIIAYDVGVGKSYCSVAAIANSIENGRSNYPLIIVPNNTYDQWYGSIKNVVNKETGKKSYGMLEHYPAIRSLYNLGVDYVKAIKDYTKEEQKKIDNLVKILAFIDESIKVEKVNPKLFDSNYYEFADSAKELYNSTKESYDIVNDEYIKAEYPKYDESGQPIELTKQSIEHYKKAELIKRKFYKTVKKQSELITPKEKFLRDLSRFIKNTWQYYIYSFGTIKEVPKGTITLITYEGLKNLGLNDYDEVVERIYEIISQGDIYQEDEKEAAKLYEKLVERVASQVSSAKVNIEDLAIDMLVIDEAHFCKKVFTSVKGSIKENDDEDNPYAGSKKKESREKSYYDLSSGQPSSRALTAYILAQYIQQNNRNRNVIGLSATPFTNSPLEVYSMLSLFNHYELVRNKLDGLKDFFDTFMQINYDIKVNADNSVSKEVVLTGFNNLPQLRTLIRSMINYKTGEEANVVRPNKIVLPSNEIGVKTSFKMTIEQQQYMKDVETYIKGDTSLAEMCMSAYNEEQEQNELAEKETIENMSEDERQAYLDENEGKKQAQKFKMDDLNETDQEGVRLLQSLSMMRQIALSPYLYKCRRSTGIIPTAQEYIETSPKLTYVCECINSVKKWHEKTKTKMSGQVIYMNAGVAFFPKIAEYLTNPEFGIGFKKEEVAMVIGGMSKSAKERVKTGFLRGDIKILIGSKAIEVGIDLQENSTVLYNCYFDWNPTDAAQVSGRIHRQGNRFANVRVVYPMCENSSDVIMFQYLGEKTARIKEIWDIEGIKSQLDLKDFDPDKLKYALITDPVKKAEIEIIRETDKLNDDLIYLQNQFTDIQRVQVVSYEFKTSKEKIFDVLKQYYSLYGKMEMRLLMSEFSSKISEVSLKLSKAETDEDKEKLNQKIIELGE
ncbi:MAG: helicase-related protein, partial [Bacteroidota bacterium]